MLKALGGPFPDVRFCPTGGVSAATAPEFLALANVVCVGGSWWFHRRGGLDRVDAFARSQTLLSLGLWPAIIICGRWIAYY